MVDFTEIRNGRPGNILPESRELAAEFVVLYGPAMPQAEIWSVVGSPVVMNLPEMLQSGYPNPQGREYYCLGLKAIVREQWPAGLNTERVTGIRQRIAPDARWGAPVATHWLELMRQ